MDYLLLGNGFDLHYNLPTSYLSFLVTIKYIRNHTLHSPLNIGNIFKELAPTCKAIEYSYNNYKNEYSKLNIDLSEISTITEKAYSNCWIEYLLKAYNEDVGWIDFENEISKVLEEFKKLFNTTNTVRYERKPNSYWIPRLAYLNTSTLNETLKCFDFFYTQSGDEYALKKDKKSYFIYDKFRDIVTLNKVTIVEDLFNELEELAEMLREYLKVFVEPIYKKHIKKSTALNNFDRIINFNYTKTFESVFFNDEDKICHLHGNIDDKLILGVNPTEDDVLPNTDSTFIRFKKYHQREVYRTSDKYFKFYREKDLAKQKAAQLLKSLNDGNTPDDTYMVSVCGHSLDPNDEAIIKLFFEKATHIIVYYHNESARLQYITNLSVIFGAQGYQDLRAQKHLELKPIEDLFNGNAIIRK